MMRKLPSAFMLLMVMTIPLSIAADTHDVDVGAKIENPFKGTNGTIEGLFSAIVERILLPIGSIIAVIAFIWSGFLFVTAQGKPAELEKAKKALLYTAIGTAVLLGATAIAKVITGTIDSLR